MAGKVGYSVRETLRNIRRNLLLTSASMLTVAVSLSLVGAAFLLRYGVDNVTGKWENGIEFEVFLDVDATPEQIEAVGTTLQDSPQVERVEFIAQAEQLELYKVLFADQPELLNAVTVPEQLPPSYRVEPAIADAEVIRALGDRFAAQPGVLEVVFPEDAVRNMLRASSISQTVIFLVASVLLLAACLLIFNTIRTAIFARRREIAVMKLVGATNWFIRVPFMIEGLVQGLLGATVAFGLVFVARNLFEEFIQSVPLFEGFVVLGSQVATTGFFTLAIGAVVGTLAAGVAVTRFLDV